MRIPIICLFWISVHFSQSYRILGIFPLPSRSHMFVFEGLMKGLAEKGHEVDVMCNFPQDKPVPRYYDISLYRILPSFVNNISVPFIRKNWSNRCDMVNAIVNEMGVDLCKTVLNSHVVKKLKNTKIKYDLVITEIFGADCMLAFGHHFNTPVASIISSGDLPWGGDRIGNPDDPSYIPNYFMPYLNRMSFLQRLINTVSLMGIKITESTRSVNEDIHKIFEPNLPDLQELIYNTSLILVNSHFSTNFGRPMVPNFIEVAGLHIQPEKPIPKYFENSLNVIPQYKGVIYLAMGAMVISESFPSYKLKELFDAFRELPYKVMWKATKGNLLKDLDVPSKIQFETWMPQRDMLCHPNVKLFVTHGGLMSTQEGIFCGVPTLGIPLFADQEVNLKRSESLGMAIVVDYQNITKARILNAAQALLGDPKYKNSAERVSNLFKDRPLSSLDSAVYWIEYVIRHNGAPHLRSVGADLPWYQYYLIDVVVFLLGCLASVLVATYYFIIAILNLLLTANVE